MYKITYVVMLVISFIIAGCMHGSSSQSEKRFSTPETYTQEQEFEVEDHFRLIKLKLDLSIDEGVYAWKVVDPEGKERWSGEISGKSAFIETQPFDPIAGTWVLEIEAEEVIGEFSLRWQGR